MHPRSMAREEQILFRSVPASADGDLFDWLFWPAGASYGGADYRKGGSEDGGLLEFDEFIPS